MNIMTQFNHNQKSMSSREVADLTEKRHPDVKRDCEIMFQGLGIDARKFAHIYFDTMNRQQTEYLLDEELTMTLVTGYNIVLRNRVIKRWKELENQTKLSDTEDDNVKSFTIPSDSTAKYAFMNVVIPSGSWDIRSGLIVDTKTTISVIDGKELVDEKARVAILNITNITSKNVYLDGKKWCVIGDSITEKNYRSTYNYHYYVANSVKDMAVYNYGISGSGFYNRSGVASTITQTDIDILTVFFGTNDWANVASHNKLLGTFLDTGTTTVSGCINTLLSALIAKFPTKIIAIFTPLPRLTNWGSNATANAQGYTLEQLSNLIIQYAKHYSLPYLDLYHESNLPVWNNDANVYYFTAPSLSTPDGLHPNDAGHKVIAGKVKAFLESIVAVS